MGDGVSAVNGAGTRSATAPRTPVEWLRLLGLPILGLLQVQAEFG